MAEMKLKKWVSDTFDGVTKAFSIAGAIAAILSLPNLQHWLSGWVPELSWVSARSSLSWTTTLALFAVVLYLGYLIGHRTRTPRKKNPPDPKGLLKQDLIILQMLVQVGDPLSYKAMATVLTAPITSIKASLYRLRDWDLVDNYLEIYSLTPLGIAYADKHSAVFYPTK